MSTYARRCTTPSITASDSVTRVVSAFMIPVSAASPARTIASIVSVSPVIRTVSLPVQMVYRRPKVDIPPVSGIVVFMSVSLRYQISWTIALPGTLVSCWNVSHLLRIILLLQDAARWDWGGWAFQAEQCRPWSCSKTGDRLTEIPSSVIGCCLSNAQSLLMSLMKPSTEYW